MAKEQGKALVTVEGAECGIEGQFTLGIALNHFFSVPFSSDFVCLVAVETADSYREFSTQI